MSESMLAINVSIRFFLKSPSGPLLVYGKDKTNMNQSEIQQCTDTAMVTVQTALFMLLIHLTRSVVSFSSSTFVPRYHRSLTTARNMFEVERKFVLDDVEAVVAIESKLMELGLFKVGEKFMVDWYFDLSVPVLTPMDNWLRYREVSGTSGSWQLKKGEQHSSGCTVYDEIEGDEAIQQALALVTGTAVQLPTKLNAQHRGYLVPDLPDPSCGLEPFCRLETNRTTWKYAHGDSRSLTVDLDRSNYGYMVGEVELVVDTKEQVHEAQSRIDEFMRKLIPEQITDSPPAIGKLEHYLKFHRPEHYRACIESGSITTKN